MSSMPKNYLIGQMTWDEVAVRIGQGAPAVLPIGAGAKEHGFHLPMNTDQLQADYFSKLIASRFGALVWPVLSFGHYPAFAAYAGSIGLSASTFELTIRELVVGLLDNGCKAVIVLDTGVSTNAPVAAALTNLERVLHVKLHGGEHLRLASAELAKQLYGSHADEIETSLMLALAPDVVEFERAQASLGVGASAGPLTPFDSNSPNYSPSGSYGDPTLASSEKGVRILEAMTRDVLETVGAFLKGNDGAKIPTRSVTS